ncbi:MAG: dihydrofolate reductase family protein [Egibacteraceae bacterium]
MRQLLPTPIDEADPYEVYRPDDPTVPLLRVNMVASADGAATDAQGRAGGLAGEGDQEVFRTLRALADGILVGASTVRVEGYGPHRLRADLARRREADGRAAPAPIVVVTRSLDLDLASPLFTGGRTPTVVLTCAAAPADRRRAAEQTARVLVVGDADVDLERAVATLRTEFGLAHLLCEGGPTLNAGLIGAGLVDELCLTIAPALTGTGRLRIVADEGPPPNPLAGKVVLRRLSLLTACEQDSELYLRYAFWPG